MNPLRSTSHREAQLRAAGDADLDALLRLFAASRDDLAAAISGWEESQQETFMRTQFEARRDQYRHRFPQAQWEVIVSDGTIIGQILVARDAGDIRLVDLSLLPAFRNRGIGRALLRDLLDEAAGAGCRVSLHVLETNPAIRLYERLGFTRAGEEGIYLRMEWMPASGESGGSRSGQPDALS